MRVAPVPQLVPLIARFAVSIRQADQTKKGDQIETGRPSYLGFARDEFNAVCRGAPLKGATMCDLASEPVRRNDQIASTAWVAP